MTYNLPYENIEYYVLLANTTTYFERVSNGIIILTLVMSSQF